MPMIVPLILAFTLILALSLSNAVLGQAARPDPNYVCFLGVQSLNDLIPIIYYAMIAMLGIGSIGTAVMSVRSGNGSPRLVMWGGAVVLALSALLMGGIDSNRAYAQTAGSCLLRDGSLAMTGNLDMGTNNITSTGSITASGGGSLTGTWSDLGTVSTVDIDGGTVDGATLGAATPAAGTLTTLAVDNTTLNANTLSTSAGDLTINPAGAVAVSKDLELAATKKLYFDGGGDTWMEESASDNINTKVGGTLISQMGGGMLRVNGNFLHDSGKTATFNSGLTAGGHVIPSADGTYNLGTQTTKQWANVWADLVNGSDIAMANGWRMLESEVYEGYPEGWAIGHGDWEDGVAVWNNPEMVAGETPVFAVTDEFVEFNGVRISNEDWSALAEMLNGRGD